MLEIWGSFKFYFGYALNKPGTHGVTSNFDDRQYHQTPHIAGPGRKVPFGEAFGVDGRSRQPDVTLPMSTSRYDENIRLAPYGHQKNMSDVEAARAF